MTRNEGPRTIRELGAEIADEISAKRHAAKAEEGSPFSNIGWQAEIAIVDLVMAVLARHAGKRLVNDADLPVVPLPPNQFATGE
jgi:hypothetical protein